MKITEIISHIMMAARGIKVDTKKSEGWTIVTMTGKTHKEVYQLKPSGMLYDWKYSLVNIRTNVVKSFASGQDCDKMLLKQINASANTLSRELLQ